MLSPFVHPWDLAVNLASFNTKNRIFMVLILSLETHDRLILAWQWRHNGRDGVSNHQPHYCLLSRLFWSRSKKTSKHRVIGLCAGIPPVTGNPVRLYCHIMPNWIRIDSRAGHQINILEKIGIKPKIHIYESMNNIHSCDLCMQLSAFHGKCQIISNLRQYKRTNLHRINKIMSLPGS